MEPYQAMELRNEQMVTSGDGGAGLDVKREDPERESPQISVKKEVEDVQQIVVKSEEEESIIVEDEKEDRQQIAVKEEDGQSSVVLEGDQEIQQIAVKEEEQPIVVEDDEEDRQQIVVKDVGQLIVLEEEEGHQIRVKEEEKGQDIVVQEEERQPIVVKETEVEWKPLQPVTMELQSEAGYCDPTDQMQTSDRELVDEAMAASDCSSATVVKEGTEESRQLQIKACLHDQTNDNFPSTQPPQQTCDSVAGRDQIIQGEGRKTRVSTTIRHQIAEGGVTQTSDHSAGKYQIHDYASERHLITGRKVSRTLAETRLLQIRTCVMRDHAYQRITTITPHRRRPYRNPCPLCSVVLQNQSALREHLKTHTVAGGKYPCKLCGAVFRVISSLKEHQHTHTGETPYTCETCGKSFKTGRKLQYHRSSHPGFKSYLCQLCGLNFFRPEQFKKHMRKHSCVCDVCGDVFSSPVLLKTHQEILNHYDFLCHVCGKAFGVYSSFYRHLKYHELSVSQNNRHSCGVCGEEFFHRAELLSHNKFSHVEDKPHKCSVCEAAYTSMWSLRKHKQSQNHKKGSCNRGFQRSHIQVSQGDKKPYQCSLCEASYFHARSLKKHEKTQHLNNLCPPVVREIRPARLPEKPYKCTLCDHAFVHEDTLRRHLLRHSNRPRQFFCEKCGMSYISKNLFLKHMMSHNPIGSQAD